MNRRLWFSVALIGVLFGFWMLMTKPVCQNGSTASLGTRFEWVCVANDR